VVGERDHAAGTRSGSPEQCFHIRITTDEPVESDDSGVWQGGCGRGEVAEEELSRTGGGARGEVARSFEISGRRVRERDARQAGEFHGDDSDTSADVEKVKPLERPTAEF